MRILRLLSLQSKYFKPGFIYNDDKNKSDENVDKTKPNKSSGIDINDDDFSDDEDLNEIISQASQKLKQTNEQQPSSSKSSHSELANTNLNEISSQPVNFTKQSQSQPSKTYYTNSLKGNNIILANSNQSKNPLIKNLQNVRVVFNDSISPAHFLLYDSCCAIFLSLKYHVIHPNYIYDRINDLQNRYQLKLLLVMIDHVIYEKSLKELTIVAIRTNFTLLPAWTYEEAAHHIENYRLNSDSTPDIIMGRMNGTNRTGQSSSESGTLKKNDPSSNNSLRQNLVETLTTIKSVNRTDAVTLLSAFETFDSLIRANTDELTVCSGISMLKARRLHSTFNKPFIRSKTIEN